MWADSSSVGIGPCLFYVKVPLHLFMCSSVSFSTLQAPQEVCPPTSLLIRRGLSCTFRTAPWQSSGALVRCRPAGWTAEQPHCTAGTRPRTTRTGECGSPAGGAATAPPAPPRATPQALSQARPGLCHLLSTSNGSALILYFCFKCVRWFLKEEKSKLQLK